MRLRVGDADAHLFGLAVQHLDGRGTRLQRTPHLLRGDPRRQPKQRDILGQLIRTLIYITYRELPLERTREEG